MEPSNSNLILCLLNTLLFMCSGKCLDRGTLSQWQTIWWMCLGTKKNTLLKDILQHSTIPQTITAELLQHFFKWRVNRNYPANLTFTLFFIFLRIFFSTFSSAFVRGSLVGIGYPSAIRVLFSSSVRMSGPVPCNFCKYHRNEII